METPPIGARPPPDGTLDAEDVTVAIDTESKFEMFCGEEDACNEPAVDDGAMISTNAGCNGGSAGDEMPGEAGAAIIGGFAGFAVVTPLPNKPFKISKSDAKLPFDAASTLSEVYHFPATIFV